MGRREAILRLTRLLEARWSEQHTKLATELASMRQLDRTQAIGDSGDDAFENASNELSSLLAQSDARALHQMERALERCREGTYGNCEGDSQNCQETIPLARLQSLPYTTLCIHCQRERDAHLDGTGDWNASAWSRIVDAKDLLRERQVNLAKLQYEWSGSRRR